MCYKIYYKELLHRTIKAIKHIEVTVVIHARVVINALHCIACKL